MLSRLDGIEIDKVIFHYIPSGRTASTETLELSDAESRLDSDSLNFLSQRLGGTLAQGAYAIEFNPSTTSVVSGLIMKYLSGADHHFVADSQEIARHLVRVQSGNSTAGMLVVAGCRVRRRRALALMKLEHDEGARARPRDHEGQTVFVLEHLRDLLLTGSARVFKAGFFIGGDGSRSNIDGRVSDNQTARGSRHSHIADYFLRDFLGCDLRENPARTTQRFYEAAEEWVNTAVHSVDKRVRYLIALMAELERHTEVLNPRIFASHYLDLEDRQNFIDWLENKDIPTTGFYKDINLIKSQLRQVSMVLESGVRVTGFKGDFAEKITVRDTEDGQAEIVIIDQLKNIRGRY